MEVRQTGPTSGEVVWSWSSWDHLIQDRYPEKPNYGVVADHPEKINLNTGDNRSDWLHFNSVRYNAKRDEVLVSTHNLDEIFVISRTSAEIVYRWGNPVNYQQGSVADEKLFGQHDARWLDADGTRISVFNNGINRFNSTPKNYSTVEEIIPPIKGDGTYDRNPNTAFGPAAPVWKYPTTPNAQYFATNISGATRMPNGNTLTCLGPQGVFIEVTSQGDEVWRYVSPVGNMGPVKQGQVPRNTMIFKIYRFGPDHPALAGRTLPKQGKLEDGPLRVEDDVIPTSSIQVDILSHRVNVSVFIGMRVRIDAYDLAGRWLGIVVDEELSPGTHVFEAPAGTYFAQ
ncbi:MAG: aryl-sulfate sulfotransferase [Candidatus Kapabacteria bacterium]|nr:aryl-sulfate sulfotransferase [Candidatus Kapabacteria bacterium]